MGAIAALSPTTVSRRAVSAIRFIRFGAIATELRYQTACRLSQTEGSSIAAAISFANRALSEMPRSSG